MTNPSIPRDEAEFLTQQSAQAKAALGQVRGDLLRSLTHSADIAAWAERYPWPTMAAALTAGVSTAWVLAGLTKPSDTSAKNLTTDKSHEATRQAEPTRAAVVTASAKPGMVGALFGSLIAAATSAAASTVGDMVKESLRGMATHDGNHANRRAAYDNSSAPEEAASSRDGELEST